MGVEVTQAKFDSSAVRLNPICSVLSLVIVNTTAEVKAARIFDVLDWYKNGSVSDGLEYNLRQSNYDMFFLHNMSKKITFKGLKLMAKEEAQLKNYFRFERRNYKGMNCSEVYTPHEDLVDPKNDMRNVTNQLDCPDFEWEWTAEDYLQVDINPGEKLTMVLTIASEENPAPRIVEKVKVVEKIVIQKRKSWFKRLFDFLNAKNEPAGSCVCAEAEQQKSFVQQLLLHQV